MILDTSLWILPPNKYLSPGLVSCPHGQAPCQGGSWPCQGWPCPRRWSSGTQAGTGCPPRWGLCANIVLTLAFVWVDFEIAEGFEIRKTTEHLVQGWRGLGYPSLPSKIWRSLLGSISKNLPCSLYSFQVYAGTSLLLGLLAWQNSWLWVTTCSRTLRPVHWLTWKGSLRAETICTRHTWQDLLLPGKQLMMTHQHQLALTVKCKWGSSCKTHMTLISTILYYYFFVSLLPCTIKTTERKIKEGKTF